jgi:hypothetical protein
MTKQDIDEIAGMDVLKDNYDSPWKEAVEHYFQEFIAFYFPEAYVEIDWSKEYLFLDQELRAVVQDAELGKRFVDKLVRVTLQNGDENWIYIHIEVQGTRQAGSRYFCERFFRAPARKISKNYATANAYGCPDSSCFTRCAPKKGCTA